MPYSKKHFKLLSIAIIIFFSAFFSIAEEVKAALVWSDEFNDGVIDVSKWSIASWDSGADFSFTKWRASQVSESGGDLIITAQESGSDWLSGYLTSKYKIQPYGALEFRAKWAHAAGVRNMMYAWTSTPEWYDMNIEDTMASSSYNNGVCDVHIAGESSTTYSSNRANPSPPPAWISNWCIKNSGSLWQDYHVWRMEWSPISVIYKLDSITQWTSTPPYVPAAPMDIFLALCTGTCNTGWGLARNPADFPVSMRVDYVRVYDASGSSPSCTKFVDKNHASANDANPGTEALPWATLQKAGSVAVAGDTVCVKQGTYNERLVPSNSGTSGSWITFKAYPGHERLAIIDGTGLITPSSSTWNVGTVQIAYKSYILVSGFKVVNTGGSGIYVGGGNNIEISGNRVEHTAHAGIQLYGAGAVNNYIVTGNEINKHGYANSDWEALSIARTDRFEIGNNIVYDPDPGILSGARILIDAKDGSKNGTIHHNEVYNSTSNSMGIYVDAYNNTTMENITIHSNKVHDIAYEGIAINVEVQGTLQNVKIYNNLIYNAGNADYGSGIVISSYAWNPTPTPTPALGSRIIKNIEIYNNTVYGSGSTSASWPGGGIIVGRQTLRLEASNIIVRNNLLFNNYKYQLRVSSCACVTGVVNENNLAYPFRGDTNEIHGAIESDPLLINPTAFDFHLQGTSPAKDAGTAILAPATDFDGSSRPVGAGYDIGAFEYGGVVPSGTPTSTPTVTSTVIPTSTVTPAPTVPPCVPSKTCADYPGQCNLNTPDGCSNTLNCWNVCTPPLICSYGACKNPSSQEVVSYPSAIPSFSWPDLFENVTAWILGIVSSITLLFLMLGGFFYISSGGDEQRMVLAKRIIIASLIGFLIIILSASLVFELDKAL